VESRIRQQFWEFKNTKESEIKKMVETFVSRGMNSTDAEMVAIKMAKYEKFFVYMMVTEHLGLQLPSDDDASLLQDAFMMFASFTGIGSLPLFSYCLGPLKILSNHDMFFYSVIATLALLFSLGAFKSNFSSVSWIVSGFETLCIGSVCGGFAYTVGRFISVLVVA
jgi:DNA damage-binding protein 1